jgi:hypothetical protein
MQKKVCNRMQMSLSSQKCMVICTNLKNILCVHEEIQEGLEIRFTNKGSIW